MFRTLGMILILTAGLSLAACSSQTQTIPVSTNLPVENPPSATVTPLPPTATATLTPLPPTPTETPLPPTETPTSTATEVPATPTAAPTQPQDSASASKSVRISNFRFGPDVLVVKVGTRVTWSNQDEYDHTVTSDDGLFDSGAIGISDSFSFTFEETGTFGYHCEFHAGMKGTIKVTP